MAKKPAATKPTHAPLKLASGYVRYPAEQDPTKYKNRWVIDLRTGEAMSKWEYQKRQHGGINPKERAKIRRSYGVKEPDLLRGSRYSNLVRSYKSKRAEKTGQRLSAIKVRGDSADAIEFKRLSKRLKKLNERLKRAGRSAGHYTAAEANELIDILDRLGLRDPDAAKDQYYKYAH